MDEQQLKELYNTAIRKFYTAHGVFNRNYWFGQVEALEAVMRMCNIPIEETECVENKKEKVI